MKHYYLVIDSETNLSGTVADLSGVIVDSKGTTHAQFAVLLNEFFQNNGETLFYDKTPGSVFAFANLQARYAAYQTMLANGTRMLCSVAAVNRWLAQANAKFNCGKKSRLFLTAYNLAFDSGHCKQSGIILDSFTDSFCLWHAAFTQWGKTKRYKKFVLENHYFNAPTAKRNMTYQTNAEVMAHFITGQEIHEPHTSLEDIQQAELPILFALLKAKSIKEIMADTRAYNWRDVQVREAFTAN